jgi:hypothetical protein
LRAPSSSSAAKSKTAHEGMCTTSLPVHFRGAEFRVPTVTSSLPGSETSTAASTEPQDVPSGVFFRRELARLQSWEPYDCQRFPTLTRGWIVQERLLPRRILHFGQEELIWECSRGRTCQCISKAKAARQSPREGSLIRLAATAPSESPRGPSGKLHRAILSRWNEVVTDYSVTHLTHDRDVFPAIAGLAKRFQTVLRPNYVAGLWEDALPQSLLWHANSHLSLPAMALETMLAEERGEWYRNARRIDRPTRWRAPSWS